VKLPRRLAFGCALTALLFFFTTTTPGAPRYGELTGVVLDPVGQPQLGASVSIDPEGVSGRDTMQSLLTDQNGVFAVRQLRPGLYAVRVTQAGFLPSMQLHIRVGAGLTTVVRVEMDSVFSSLDQLRRQPSESTKADDWKWVLRTSSATRPVLQLRDGTIVLASGESSSGDAPRAQPSTRIEMTAGSRQPGSASALPGSPATAVSYDQPLGGIGHLLVAGEMSYEPQAGTGATFASMWLPSGQLDQGSETTVVVREAHFAPGGQTIRSMRAEHSGQIVLGERLVVDYGAAYVADDVDGGLAATVRPRGKIGVRVSQRLSAAFSVESEPGSYGLRARNPAPESALDTLDTLPILVWNSTPGSRGRATLEDNWHEEFAVKRDVGAHGSIEGATYHDYSGHTAVFGYDAASGPNSPAPFPFVYARDGGANSTWGTRLAYMQKLSSNLELAAIYAWAGALAPEDGAGTSSNHPLPDMLSTQYRHSVAAKMSGKIPHAGTQIAASYKWINGTVVSRQDLFGEAAFGLDPNLSVAVRQPLPSFGRLGSHRWEAVADFRNLLAQGYVPVYSHEGRAVLMPVLRSFRGGVSFQF
jgi:Carboxypeptidase regulatory-like domain